MTQKQQTLKELNRFRKITSLTAFKKYGITRLASIVHRLKRDGVLIKSVFKSSLNRYGQKVTFVEYQLIKKKK